MINVRDATQHRARLVQVRDEPLRVERYIYGFGHYPVMQSGKCVRGFDGGGGHHGGGGDGGGCDGF